MKFKIGFWCLLHQNWCSKHQNWCLFFYEIDPNQSLPETRIDFQFYKPVILKNLFSPPFNLIQCRVEYNKCLKTGHLKNKSLKTGLVQEDWTFYCLVFRQNKTGIDRFQDSCKIWVFTALLVQVIHFFNIIQTIHQII